MINISNSTNTTNATNTIVQFTNVQKGFLPIAILPCFVLSYMLYKFARRPIIIGETIGKRMIYFYSLISSIL